MKRYKVVITDREYDNIESEKHYLETHGCEVYDYQYKNEEDILRVAKDADAIIVQYAKMSKELIEQLENCKVIARYAMGFDGIDLQAAADKGIYVCNVRDYCYEEVATHSLALLLEFSRRVAKYNEWTHRGNWHAMPGKQHCLKKQTIGVVSFGKIARSFIDKVKPLCDNIWVYDAYVNDEDIREYGVIPKSLEEICVNSDYISVHCPLTDDTRYMFNKQIFKKMKKNAVLINVGRGAIICEDDLVWALENHEIGGAALDVLETEPPKSDNPLFSFENVIITPHTAWYSVESQAILQMTPAEEVVRVLNGEKPHNVVNGDMFK